MDDQEEDALRMLVRGQVAIPVELLDRYGMTTGDEIECRPTEDGLLVWKSENQPDDPLVRFIGIAPWESLPAAASSTNWVALTLS